jgi:hypothetical protein
MAKRILIIVLVFLVMALALVIPARNRLAGLDRAVMLGTHTMFMKSPDQTSREFQSSFSRFAVGLLENYEGVIIKYYIRDTGEEYAEVVATTKYKTGK